jgi:hypothetical protein
VIEERMSAVRLGDEKKMLMSQFETLQEKFTGLAEMKAELQQQLIVSEEDRLKIAEKEKFELQSQLVSVIN